MKKNKVVKVLVILSIIIIVLGFVTAIGINISLDHQVTMGRVIFNGDDFTLLVKLFKIIGNVAIYIGIICLSLIIIGFMWLTYLVIYFIKKLVVVNGKLSVKKLIIIIISIIAIFLLVLFLISSGSINYKYKISYHDYPTTYDIYKTENGQIIVDTEIPLKCKTGNSCGFRNKRIKLKFSNENMLIVNNFIDEISRNEGSWVSIYYNDFNYQNLTDKQIKILNSIIHNNESLLDDLNDI